MKPKWPKCRLPRIKNRAGRCYELACKGLMRAPDWLLVHGRYGHDVSLGHAWLLREGQIFCPTYDRLFEEQLYYAFANAVPEVTYTHVDAAVNIVRQGHYGPWERMADSNGWGDGTLWDGASKQAG